MSYTLKVFNVCNTYVCSCSSPSFSSPANSSHPPQSSPDYCTVLQFSFVRYLYLLCCRSRPSSSRPASNWVTVTSTPRRWWNTVPTYRWGTVWTCMINGMENMHYEERLIHLGLINLETRRNLKVIWLRFSSFLTEIYIFLNMIRVIEEAILSNCSKDEVDLH